MRVHCSNMKIPKVQITGAVLQLLADIETQRQLLSAKTVPLHINRAIGEKSILKSALYSARIEGNSLEEDMLEKSVADIQQQEVFQLVDALRHVRSLSLGSIITLDTLRHIHHICMNGIHAEAGLMRKNQNAIFDASGAVVHLPPPPLTMRSDMEQFITYLRKPQEFPLIHALMAHLIFEKIHPFTDGNGRVGRLLILLVLQSYRAIWPYVLPFERSLERERSLYYHHLQQGMTSPVSYLHYMLDTLRHECDLMNDEIETKLIQNTDIKLHGLSPRQLEIHTLLKEHSFLSTDQISRRFLKVPARTIRTDISRLLKDKLIEKIGTTRGAMYRVGK